MSTGQTLGSRDSNEWMQSWKKNDILCWLSGLDIEYEKYNVVISFVCRKLEVLLARYVPWNFLNDFDFMYTLCSLYYDVKFVSHEIIVFQCFSHWLLCPRPRRGGGGIRRSSASVVRPSVCLSDVAYIGSNSKTKRPRKTKLCTGVPPVTCDSHTDFKVKRPKVKVGRGNIVAAT